VLDRLTLLLLVGFIADVGEAHAPEAKRDLMQQVEVLGQGSVGAFTLSLRLAPRWPP
jgi:hypothetical protein